MVSINIDFEVLQFICSLNHSPGLMLDIFHFPAAAQDILLCPTTTLQGLPESIH